MTRYSLRVRLLAGAAVAIFVALAAAWVVMTLLFQAQIEQRVEQELTRDALQLIGGLSIAPNGTIQIAEPPTDPRFDAPTSGLYWQATVNGVLERSRSLWDQVLADSPTADAMAWRTRIADGPFGDRLFLLERIVQPVDSTQPVLIQLAMDEEEIRLARAEFGTWMALFLSVLWALLSLAAWFQVQLGLSPLARLQHELAALRHNAAERLSADYPSEVEPLTRAINDLANAREADVKRARQRAADLAHGMKTPLAALAAQSRLIREGNGDPREASDGLDRAIAAAGAAVEAELARARAAASRHARHDAQVAPRNVVQGLVLVLERTEKGMTLDYDLDIPPDLRVRVSAEDLSEIMGPLLENAVRFARRGVRVTGETEHGKIALTVEDDGPGIKASDAADAMVRGTRLDQAGGGHGLGLAIARDLVEATGGTIALGTSSLGGLKVDLTWPLPGMTRADADTKTFWWRRLGGRLERK